MSDKKPLIESMTKLKLFQMTKMSLVIRVWRTEESFLSTNNFDLHQWATEKNQMGYSKTMVPRDIVEELLTDLAKLPRIAAVEVLDQNGNGFVYYTDWP